MGAFVTMLKLKKAPRNLYISRWVGLRDPGFITKQSLLVPWSFRLLGDLMSKGKTSDYSSRTMFSRESLKGPLASMDPSPTKLAYQQRESTPASWRNMR